MTADVCAPASRSQQLCVKLEPRGLLYVKLSLQERWDTQVDQCVHCCSPTTLMVPPTENSPRSSAHQHLLSTH